MKPFSNTIISILNNTPWMFKYDEILHAFTPTRKHQMHGITMWEPEEAIDAAVEWANKEKIPYFNFNHINTNIDSLRHYCLLDSKEWSAWHERMDHISQDAIHDAEIDFQPTYPGDTICPASIAEGYYWELKELYNSMDEKMPVHEFFDAYEQGAIK